MPVTLLLQSHGFARCETLIHQRRRETSMTQPLSGIRVLDLSRLLPGAYATQMLADFGADVIKVEEPGMGDYGRFMPPHGVGGMSLYFLAINRNKRSVTLNLKSGKGREVLLRLART